MAMLVCSVLERHKNVYIWERESFISFLFQSLMRLFVTNELIRSYSLFIIVANSCWLFRLSEVSSSVDLFINLVGFSRSLIPISLLFQILTVDFKKWEMYVAKILILWILLPDGIFQHPVSHYGIVDCLIELKVIWGYLVDSMSPFEFIDQSIFQDIF